MKTLLAKKLLESKQEAEKKLSGLSAQEKHALEKSWDVEHAYYTSALEGKTLDKKEFERLGKKVS